MSVIKANLVVYQGATFEQDIQLSEGDGTPYDLTGYTAQSQFRKHHASSNAYAFTVEHNDAGGKLTLRMTAEETNDIPPGRYHYDVEIVEGDKVLRVLQGIVTVDPNMTR